MSKPAGLSNSTSFLLLLGMMTGIPATALPGESRGDRPRPVGAADVAKLPHPGGVVPGAFAFTPDGAALTFLKSESNSLSRVLWRVELGTLRPRVVARPPGGGDTDTNISEAEKLRRERQRLRETGITQVVRAEEADVAVVPLQGDLYLQRGDGPLERITKTESPEIDPKLTKDGSKVAFVRDNELFVLDLATRRETRHSRGAEEGLTHGLAEYIAQGRDGPAHGLLVVARRSADRLPGDRRTAHPALHDRPSRGRKGLGRNPPLPVRGGGQRQGAPRCSGGKVGRHALAHSGRA